MKHANSFKVIGVERINVLINGGNLPFRIENVLYMVNAFVEKLSFALWQLS